MSSLRAVTDIPAALDSVEAAIPHLSRAELPGVIAHLERVKTVCLFAGMTSPPAAAEDRLLDVKEAAIVLGVSPTFVKENSAKYPFTIRQGRRLLFSHRGIQVYLSKRRGDGGKV